MTRARAKLLKQQVNLFLSDTLIDENFILPKSYYLCMIRYEEGASIARGGEEQLDVKLYMKTSHGRAREEMEACARKEEAAVRPAAMPGRPAPTPAESESVSTRSDLGRFLMYFLDFWSS